MQKLDDILKSYIADAGDKDMINKIPGAAFVVVDKNGPIYHGSGGRLPSMHSDRNFNIDTQVWVASMTKIVTAICCMQIVEKGLISLDGDIKNGLLIPELAKLQILLRMGPGRLDLVDNPNPITLRMLLTHTAGLGYDLADRDLMDWSRMVNRRVNNLSFTWTGWYTPLRHASGTGWLYGSGVDWASKALSFKTGQSLGRYMEENIFKPLGLKNTGFKPATFEASTSVTRSADQKLRPEPNPVPSHPKVNSGGCGLYTTAADYSKILAALLKASSPAGEGGARLLRQETVDEMFRPQLSPLQRISFGREMRLDRELIPWVPPSYPLGRLDHGITGVINLDDVPGKRKEGSMSWLGMNNGHWWIDRKSGIAACLMVSVLPIDDPVVNKLYNRLELAVYSDLLPSMTRSEADGS